MDKTIETIAGDTPGLSYSFPVYRFGGRKHGAPRAYLQAALHGDELPGTVALDRLMERLRRADAEGRIAGPITVVPAANPIGRSQELFGAAQGRFHLGTRSNFNRDFPLLAEPDIGVLPVPEIPESADQRLKRRLLELAIGADIVLDLHCDDEGLPYLYAPSALWPAMSDCAAALGVEAVVLWEGPGGGAFEEAAIHPYLQSAAAGARLERLVVTTVEYRGVLDVDAELAARDCAGLYRLLVGRGVVDDPQIEPAGAYARPVLPIGHLEMVATPVAGAILYAVRPGDQVAAGELLATVVHAPGEPDGRLEIRAPQAGFVLTRRSVRVLTAGANLLKLAGVARSADARSGVLED